MEALFLKLVNMSITASWLVLAIIAVRLIFKKTPKWIHCLLWGLVAFRLICPFTIESSLSLIPSAEPLSQDTVYASESAKQARGDILDADGHVLVERQPPAARGEILDSEGNVVLEVNDGVVSYPELEETPSWPYYFSKIWLLGICGMVIYTMVSYYLLKRKVATAIPVRRGIKQSEFVDSPFVLGIIRPVIYLPFDMAEEDKSYVIAHEKAHIRRRDHWWKPLGFLLLSIYWFNPLLWVAYILLCRDIESACDEKVIRDMDKDDRRAYSSALLNCSVRRRRIAACPLAFGEVGVKARVKGVMNYKKPTFWVILITLIVSIIVAVCFLTNPESTLPIKMSAMYVNRTTADLKFHYDDSLSDGEYKIGEAYALESLVDGNWQELTRLSDNEPSEEVFEVQSSNSEYDAWTVLKWEDYYGSLPDGTYRIRKEITIINDSGESVTDPIYIEFTIGGTADEYVTYTLEDITPTGAKLYEHEKVEDDSQLIYDGDEGIWLEALNDGQWAYVEPTQYIEPILKKDMHFIHQLIYPSEYIQLDWSGLYGELPDGTYRLAREVTNTEEDDLRVCTAYVEFTIDQGKTPVTISLENVRPTGATILFHQNQDLIDGSLICGHEYFLQQEVDGAWVPVPGIAEVPFPDQTYDIAVLHHHGVDWEQLYGRLPVGSYRLGKEIPITSGENPDYTTVYAEFTIDNVYTWFDRYSTNTEEYYPKDNVVDLFGLDGVSVSYGSSVNEILLITSEGSEPIISCDTLIRNAFLTDLTSDSIVEVCATVQMEDGMHVQVYDAVEKKLYELPPVEGGFYVLTKKADRLCVLRNSANWIAQEYGQLSLNTEKGLEIRELDPEVQVLTEKIVCVDVQNRKHACVSSAEQLETAVTLLRDLEQRVQPASKQELTAAQEDSFNNSHITINYELGEKTITFSEDFGLVWEYGSSEGYRITDSEAIRTFVQSATDGVRGNQATGEPFATASEPWNWCANINSAAVESAQIHVCLSTYSNGNSSGSSSTNGVISHETLQGFIDVLNQIPKSSISPEKTISKESYHSLFINQQVENTSVAIVDGVNNLGVIFNYRDGKVTMLLTDEMEKVKEDDMSYLEPTQLWTVQDEKILEFMESITENPPVINYSVGAEYEWQDQIEFSSGDFSLKMRLIEGWESEHISNSTDSGIRCRPDGITEGWIYFSFWPRGYTVEEEGRYFSEGQWMGYPTKTSYPSTVKTATSFDTRNAIWSYEAIYTEIGDFVIINDGADSWFMDYKDQISDTITLLDFSVK